MALQTENNLVNFPGSLKLYKGYDQLAECMIKVNGQTDFVIDPAKFPNLKYVEISKTLDPPNFKPKKVLQE